MAAFSTRIHWADVHIMIATSRITPAGQTCSAPSGTGPPRRPLPGYHCRTCKPATDISSLFVAEPITFLGFLITTPLLGAVFGLIWSQLGFTAVTQRGARDFASVSQIVATKYEVLAEHNVAERARELLAAMPLT